MNFSSFILFSIERNMITNKFGLEVFYSAFKDSCGEDFDKKNKYGDNTSNALLYSLVSGGYPSIFFLILIYFEIIKIFIVYKEKILMNKSIYINFSVACLIFFSIRSFFENSFSLFSIDFLIAYMSIAYIISKNKVK